MYRLSGPNLIIYVPILVVGILVVTLLPNYMGATRILSFTSLVIGEAGMSFIPVLLFFPKATLRQVMILAFIYLLNTFIMCIAAWGFYTLALTNRYAFLWQDQSFHINTYALFAANIFSLINIVLCFKLIYDEELAQKAEHKKKSLRKEQPFGFRSFKSPLLKRPHHEDFTSKTLQTSKETSSSPFSETRHSKSKQTDEFFFEEEINKPFQFEPDIDTSFKDLPEESSGKLFAGNEDQEGFEPSEFFDDEETERQSRKIEDSIFVATKTKAEPEAKQKEKITPKASTQTGILPPPTDIKNDLTIIFEQYSSLNAIKKLTSGKTGTASRKKKEKRQKPYVIPKDIPESPAAIEGDVHEASYRLVTEAEKLAEVKDNLKKEIHQEILSKIDQKTNQIEESLGKTEVLKDDILNSIKSVKDELLTSIKEEIEGKFKEKEEKKESLKEEIAKEEMTKELQQSLLEKLDQKISQIEESTHKHLEKMEQIKDTLKEEINQDLLSKFNEKSAHIESSIAQAENLKKEILESIQSVKSELLENLKGEIEQKFENQSKAPVTPKETKEEEKLENILNSLIKESKIKGLQFLNLEGNIIAEKWEENADKTSNSEQTRQLFNELNSEVNKTNQGNLCNILLELENETIVVAKLENKILTVYTEGTGPILSGQVLRAIAKVEDKI